MYFSEPIKLSDSVILLSNDFMKDTPLQRYLRVTEPNNILGKKSTAIFALHLLLFPDKISSFSGKVASHKSIERKTMKRGTKLDIEKGRNRNRACTKNKNDV